MCWFVRRHPRRFALLSSIKTCYRRVTGRACFQTQDLCDDCLDVTDEQLEHGAARGIVLAVDELKDISIEDSFEPLKTLVKQIRVCVDNYIVLIDDHLRTEYWHNLRGDVVTTRARLSRVQQLRTPSDAAKPAPRSSTNRKRRRPERTDESTNPRKITTLLCGLRPYQLLACAKYNESLMSTAICAHVPRSKPLSFL
ncbi:hypothetical protein PHMEG_00017159 [Phytophthora megakarya]|uniref:Uncharacterized protein n=1 Tax=Phytophthora megakarya TaxID=4795 RepID=A0A225VX72_9STRA|nr:hypothetical protein PHMEG_00017159 [Phytophthora megakarya]